MKQKKQKAVPVAFGALALVAVLGGGVAFGGQSTPAGPRTSPLDAEPGDRSRRRLTPPPGAGPQGQHVRVWHNGECVTAWAPETRDLIERADGHLTESIVQHGPELPPVDPAKPQKPPPGVTC